MARSYQETSPRTVKSLCVRIALVLLVLLVLLPLPRGAVFADPEEPSIDSALVLYEERGRALLVVVQKEGSTPDVVARATELTELARFLSGEFAVAYPPCGPYLGASLNVLRVLDEISVEEVERSYHADSELPEAPNFCYHAKDLIVHPASVIVLARDDNPSARNQMAAELLEVLAHLAALEQLFDLADPEPSGSEGD